MRNGSLFQTVQKLLDAYRSNRNETALNGCLVLLDNRFLLHPSYSEQNFVLDITVTQKLYSIQYKWSCWGEIQESTSDTFGKM
jgi:hypothetical protein